MTRRSNPRASALQCSSNGAVCNFHLSLRLPVEHYEGMVPPDRLTYLFNTYHDALVRYLTRRVGDPDWAEEVAQETFVRALAQPVIASERSWLFAVATNLVRDGVRKDARQRARLELMRSEQETEADGATLDDGGDVAREDERARARAAIALLAERDRDALLMKEEGLSYPEIASALDLSVGSVGTTLSRARRRLMEAYESLDAAVKVRPA